MATQWWREPWRKLFVKLDAKWLGLSVSARGLADELIKYADADGHLFQVASPAEAGKEIAIRLCARPREYRRITEDVAELLRDTYLVIDDGVLSIRNFRDAQERLSPEARRQRAKRERDRNGERDRDDDRDTSRDETVTGMRDSHRESNRIESIRIEETPTRAHACDWKKLQDAWLAATGNIGANGLFDVGQHCEGHAELVGMTPNEYAVKAIGVFCAWVDGCPPAKRPQKSPQKFVEHFARVHEMVTGKRQPVEQVTERNEPEPRPRPKHYVAGRYEEP